MFNDFIAVALHGFLMHWLGTSAALFLVSLHRAKFETILRRLIGSPLKHQHRRPTATHLPVEFCLFKINHNVFKLN